MRRELKRPFGKLIKNEELNTETITEYTQNKLVITCGDRTTQVIHGLGIKINLAIIDHKTKRETIQNQEEILNMCRRTINISNPAAEITTGLEEVLKREINTLAADRYDSVLLDVQGEEDLAFIPCVLYSPDGTVVMYGQPDQGLVLAVVDKGLKEEIQDIYDRMENTTQGSR